jgi:hypothetical protein
VDALFLDFTSCSPRTSRVASKTRAVVFDVDALFLDFTSCSPRTSRVVTSNPPPSAVSLIVTTSLSNRTQFLNPGTASKVSRRYVCVFLCPKYNGHSSFGRSPANLLWSLVRFCVTFWKTFTSVNEKCQSRVGRCMDKQSPALEVKQGGS